MGQNEQDADAFLISYFTLRLLVGVIGILLPLVLVLGNIPFEGWVVRGSISEYYYTNLRDVFVGSLFAIAVFLLCYQGFRDKEVLTDNVLANLAGIFALGIAIFPTERAVDPIALATDIGKVHYAFTGLFFGTLAYLSIARFTRTDPDDEITEAMKLEIRIYQACGWTLVFLIVLIALVQLTSIGSSLKRWSPVFWLESLAIAVFGLSWLTKSRALANGVNKIAGRIVLGKDRTKRA